MPSQLLASSQRVPPVRGVFGYLAVLHLRVSSVQEFCLPSVPV